MTKAGLLPASSRTNPSRNYNSTSYKQENESIRVNESDTSAQTQNDSAINRFSKIAQGGADANLILEKNSYASENISHADEDDTIEIFEFIATCGRGLCCCHEKLYEWYISIIKEYIIDPEDPEFSTVQLHTWAIILGIIMGAFTALYHKVVHIFIDLVWVDFPEYLKEEGYFTEIDGNFPLTHYMWIMPTIGGAVLSYICAVMPPIPGQNEWIDGLHTEGILDGSTIFQILVISILGMTSGLSLGPELPLVLMAGMLGSKLATVTKQSMLRARVLNLTCAAAAIGGFFKFPMAGALFVLELPHRMGLQYFEALSPATLASIIAVIVNRTIESDEAVDGYFSYPFLNDTLPFHIFFLAIIFGLVGSFVGVVYARVCLYLKTGVHDWFHEPHHHQSNGASNEENMPLVGNPGAVASSTSILKSFSQCYIKGEPLRATIAGALAGFIVGIICMFLPHSLFWGEGQLQTMIDRGRTPLPFFGAPGSSTEDLTAWGYCMTDKEDSPEEFGMVCAGVISFAKIVTTGLSLGTGIIGGHFWGPLYTGAAAAWFVHDIFRNFFPFLPVLSQYPCIGILCIMGSTHVVTYRTHTAIMLVLTLTISNFVSEDGLGVSMGDYSAVFPLLVVACYVSLIAAQKLFSTKHKETGVSMGDYSAVFPLLVVACYVSLIAAQKTIFYKTQRGRGDIIAVPEVLCEPRKEGNPQYPTHTLEKVPENLNDTESDSSGTESDSEAVHPLKRGNLNTSPYEEPEFSPSRRPPRGLHRGAASLDERGFNSALRFSHTLPGSRSRLDSSDSVRSMSSRTESVRSTSSRPSLNRVASYGHVEAQPSLMDQGKQRRSHSRTHSRQSSIGSNTSSLASFGSSSEKGGVFAAATADVDLKKLMGLQY
eukprot:CAMPEP_0194348544 /NCGR_PEP_ID=MMETSP0171-20130528/106589_1 /TAXON_ID=218684 /ORGANISM="Corethron pennatum, Strain L29A3" /LENGTH=881 /DNA_ID=CAMNT_0039115895 /DNA_START=100 /DNA_END=2746 /DNA_ORIENTATION=-